LSYRRVASILSQTGSISGQSLFENIDQPFDLLRRVVVHEADADHTIIGIEAEGLTEVIGVHVTVADRDTGSIDDLGDLA